MVERGSLNCDSFAKILIQKITRFRIRVGGRRTGYRKNNPKACKSCLHVPVE